MQPAEMWWERRNTLVVPTMFHWEQLQVSAEDVGTRRDSGHYRMEPPSSGFCIGVLTSSISKAMLQNFPLEYM